MKLIFVALTGGYNDMNVLMITPYYPPKTDGGISTYAHALSTHLHKLGNYITVVHVPFTPMISDEYTHEVEDGISIYRFTTYDRSITALESTHDYHWAKITVNTLRALGCILNGESRFDVAHINDLFGAMYMEWLKEIYRIPVVLTMHGMNTQLGSFADSMKRYAIANADRIIMVSENIRDSLLTKYGDGILGTKTTVVYNGVDIRFSEIGTCTSERVITFCGRLVSRKSPSIFLEAIKILHNKGIVFHAQIIGNGALYHSLNEYCKIHALHNIVTFLGPIPNDEVRDRFRNSMIHIICSSQETFGLTALEAMAEGACVVAPSIGGLIEFISNRENGLLYTYGRADELAEKIEEIFIDNVLRDKLINNGFATARSFSWELAAEKTLQVYREAMCSSITPMLF